MSLYFKKKHFTTAAMDNIGHNSTATTASNPFHGKICPFFSTPFKLMKVKNESYFKLEIAV